MLATRCITLRQISDDSRFEKRRIILIATKAFGSTHWEMVTCGEKSSSTAASVVCVIGVSCEVI